MKDEFKNCNNTHVRYKIKLRKIKSRHRINDCILVIEIFVLNRK